MSNTLDKQIKQYKESLKKFKNRKIEKWILSNESKLINKERNCYYVEYFSKSSNKIVHETFGIGERYTLEVLKMAYEYGENHKPYKIILSDKVTQVSDEDLNIVIKNTK